ESDRLSTALISVWFQYLLASLAETFPDLMRRSRRQANNPRIRLTVAMRCSIKFWQSRCNDDRLLHGVLHRHETHVGTRHRLQIAPHHCPRSSCSCGTASRNAPSGCQRDGHNLQACVPIRARRQRLPIKHGGNATMIPIGISGRTPCATPSAASTSSTVNTDFARQTASSSHHFHHFCYCV